MVYEIDDLLTLDALDGMDGKTLPNEGVDYCQGAKPLST